jgi:hypothetical protein
MRSAVAGASSPKARDGARAEARFTALFKLTHYRSASDLTETARQLAGINQHFRQASFAEFEMLMGLDYKVLKLYGLPKPMIERALTEAYETVVLDQEKSQSL